VNGAPGIYDALVAAAADDPDHVFLRDGEKDVTYGEIVERADRDAARLAELGLGAGSRIVLWLPNGADFAGLFFACARVGAVAVMAGTRLRALDIRHILADSQADALVFSPRFLHIDYDAMVQTAVGDRAALPRLAHLVATRPSVVPRARCLSDLPAEVTPPVFRDADAPAVVCYTSGTTGRPKGCVHSHAVLIRNGTVAVRLTGLGPGDRIVCPVPFAHVFGFHMGLLQTALAGATLVNAEPYDAGRLLDIAASARGTVLYAVPTMAREAVAAQRAHPRDLSALRLALVAGAPVSSGLRVAIRAEDGLGCDVSVVYGCSEAPTITQLVPGDPPAQALTSAGRPTDGVDMRIVGPGSSDPVPAGEVGEIAVRGYNCMLGYLDDPAATEAKYRDGWLVTGDLGALDDDRFLHLVGRASEMFLVGGFNAYPREIEAQLELLQGVAEVAVVGVPDDRLGWVPMAWAVVDDPHLGEPEILAWARCELASFKRPRYVRVVESLPRTANGKLSRVKLAQLARRALPHLPWEGRDA
jgi:fatty-acyl-CoA synthase